MTPIQREMAAIVRKEIVPSARLGVLLPVIVRFPLRLPPKIQSIPCDKPLLKIAKHQHSATSDLRWPEQGVKSSRYPFIACVIEGEADLRFGLTEHMAAQSNVPLSQPGVFALALPQQSLVIVPPHTPFLDGSRVHWERPHPEKARSRIFWMQILPSGAVVYTCRTNGLSHNHGSTIFIRDNRLATLVQCLTENPDDRGGTGEVTSTLLQALFACLDQALHHQQALTIEKPSFLLTDSEPDELPAGLHDESRFEVVARACQYIRSHLTDTLSPSQIAQHAFVSEARLNRLFRAELNTSVMKYVTQCRIEEARVLLRETDLPIRDVSVICGYPHRTHFCRVFTQMNDMSPYAFRRGRRNSKVVGKSEE
jgi:AraC-like DNA-binding protein